MLDPRALQLFVALSQDLHFGRTAERLNIAQSTLSTQLLRLEDMLGAPLFHRHKRSAVRLTDAGRIFLEEAHEALDRLARAERVGRLAGRGEAGPLELGYVFSAALNGVLSGAIRSLRCHLPHLAIAPVLMETPDQITAVAERRLDIGLIRPRPCYPEGVQGLVVHCERLVLGISDDHALATADRISPEALRHETFLVPQFNERHGLQEKLQTLCDVGGLAFPDVHRTRDFVTAASMAAGNMGVVLAPLSLSNLRISGLRFVEIDGFAETIEIAMISRLEAASNGRRAYDLLEQLQALSVARRWSSEQVI